MQTSNLKLSNEQELFIEKALIGKNILVDACIGSGKTTAIQYLCDKLPETKRVLYLTYNTLLKTDAKSKIKKKNVTVTNYHGFAYWALRRQNISVGTSDLIQTFIRVSPNIEKYDVLIIDEYQDIEQELAELLQLIKIKNSNMQIIAVGDMKQKIYDKTTLDVESFIKDFLGEHILLSFTKCFRLSKDLAEFLGVIWKKEINGVNPDCKVEIMSKENIVSFLANKPLGDILCLGAQKGIMSDTLNILEDKYPDRFNKKTVYASISDSDSKVTPQKNHAIFTTYDSSKGLERKICVIFDYTESYWNCRITKPQQSYTILRNIFCVAASRGKQHIIFVKSDDEMLSEETLSSVVETNQNFNDMAIGEMFDFKYKEDVEKCFSLLKTFEIKQNDNSLINIQSEDGYIDLSPCIGIYQEAAFFDNYEIDEEIKLKLSLDKRQDLYYKDVKDKSLNEKILYLLSLDTKQERYKKQATIQFVNEEQSQSIKARLETKLNRNDDAQIECQIDFSDQEKGEVKFSAKGFADVVKDNIVYELKFVSELAHEHFLQCACYMIALNLPKGVLWNIRDNTLYEIEISDRKKFMDAVAETVTKGTISKYYKPIRKSLNTQKSYPQNTSTITIPENPLNKNITDTF